MRVLFYLNSFSLGRWTTNLSNVFRVSPAASTMSTEDSSSDGNALVQPMFYKFDVFQVILYNANEVT